MIWERHAVEAVQEQHRAIPATTIRGWTGQWNVHSNVLLLYCMPQLGIDAEAIAVPPRPACISPAGARSYVLLVRHFFRGGIPPDPGTFYGQFFPAVQAELGRLRPALGLFRVLGSC